MDQRAGMHRRAACTISSVTMVMPMMIRLTVEHMN